MLVKKLHNICLKVYKAVEDLRTFDPCKDCIVIVEKNMKTIVSRIKTENICDYDRSISFCV